MRWALPCRKPLSQPQSQILPNTLPYMKDLTHADPDSITPYTIFLTLNLTLLTSEVNQVHRAEERLAELLWDTDDSAEASSKPYPSKAQVTSFSP